MKRVILIHGWEGEPQSEWRPWLKSELMKRGIEVVVPMMPSTAHPKMEPWIEALTRTVSESAGDTYMVGHSLGCIAILRFLEAPACTTRIKGTILVAGFGEDLKYSGYAGELSSFFVSPLDWRRIRSHCEKFVSIHSDNDSWVDISNSDLFASNLKAKTHICHNMDHFSGSDGVTELPIVLDELDELMEQS